MNDYTEISQQVQSLIQQHAPTGVLSGAVPIALGLLVFGVGFSVLGAKLSRFLVTGIFVIAGAMMGVRFGNLVETAPPLFALVGATVFGSIGYLSFRVWVGAMAAVVFAAVALGAFSNQKLLPHFQDFQRDNPMTARVSESGLTVPDREEQVAHLQRTPQDWWREFWQYVGSRDARVQRQAEAVGLASLGIGLLFGLLATRATLIFATSLFGTTCLGFALATLLSSFSPASYEAMLGRPGLAGIAFGSFLITSLVLQTLLTRKVEPPPKTSPSAS